MEVQQKTIILQNPDGSIQVATQPHFKGKKLLQCYGCKNRLIYSGNANKVQCTFCKIMNGVPNANMATKPSMVSCASCGRPCPLQQVDTMLIGNCGFCGK